MPLAADIAIALIALLHVYILVIEMFFWNKPLGLRAFGLPKELADKTVVLGANQGLYNGFIAAGLFTGLGLGEGGGPFKWFFLLCVLVAGVFGALTASRKILFVQAVPALIALVLLFLAGR